MKYIYIISLTIFLFLIAGCEESNVEKRVSSVNNPSSNITLQKSENDIRVGKPNQQTKNRSNPASPINQEDDRSSSVSVSKRIHNNLPKYTFILVGKELEDGSFYPAHIEIISSASRKLIQILKSKDQFDNDGYGLSSLDIGRIEFIDLNNDGYLDLRIQTEMGATGNDWYATYIYMPGLKKYKYHEALSMLSGVKVDPKSKQITTYWRMGWCSEFVEYFNMDKKGRLVLRKIAWTEMTTSHSDKVCFTITGIPRDKSVANLGYNFYHGGHSDLAEFLQKNVKVIKKDIVYGTPPDWSEHNAKAESTE